MPRNAEVTRALLPGSAIKDCRVERVLAATELALTYLADEFETGQTGVIQEYFPPGFAHRVANGGVSVDLPPTLVHRYPPWALAVKCDCRDWHKGKAAPRSCPPPARLQATYSYCTAANITGKH